MVSALGTNTASAPTPSSWARSWSSVRG